MDLGHICPSNSLWHQGQLNLKMFVKNQESGVYQLHHNKSS